MPKRRIPIRISSPRRSKFGVRTDKIGKLARTVDGIIFASQREANRYCELKVMREAGKIGSFEMQTRFPITVNGKNIATYVADFWYIENGKVIVEDVKGFKTPVYRLKKKLVEALHGIKITEL